MIFGEACEIQIGEDVAEQDQALEAGFLQHARGFARMAGISAQMQIREDQRVVPVRIHNLVVAGECYEVVNIASILVHRVNALSNYDLATASG